MVLLRLTLQCIGWHPKGNVIIAGTQGGQVWMWMANGQYMNVFSGHKGPICSALFSLDGKQLITASEDSTVRVWDPKAATTNVFLQGHGFHEDAITSLAIHPSNGNLIGTTCVDGTAIVSNITSGKPIAAKKDHTDSVETIAFSNAVPYVATGSLDKSVIVYDGNTMQQRSRWNMM
jgi:ribosome assembly protein SQT1